MLDLANKHLTCCVHITPKMTVINESGHPISIYSSTCHGKLHDSTINSSPFYVNVLSYKSESDVIYEFDNTWMCTTEYEILLDTFHCFNNVIYLSAANLARSLEVHHQFKDV